MHMLHIYCSYSVGCSFVHPSLKMLLSALLISGVPSRPVVRINQIGSHRLHVNWTVPGLDEQAQTIDYYIVKIDDNPPILVKNTSATLFAEQLDSTHTISIRAVDMCGQKGEEAQEVWMPQVTTQEPTTETELTARTTTEAHVETSSVMARTESQLSKGMYTHNFVKHLLFTVLQVHN